MSLRKSFIPLALVLFFAFYATPAIAAEFRSEQGNVIISQSINDNLVLSGGTVDYRGDVGGDLIVAGGNVDVNGNVDGSIIVAAGRVKVLGNVKNNIYAAGGNVELTRASVGRDIFAAGGGLALSRESTVAGSAYVTGGSLLSNGSIGKDLAASVGDVEVGGRIGRNARINSSNLKLTSSGKIGRDLIYESPNRAVFERGSTVAGSIKYTKTSEKGRVSVPVGLLITGMITSLIVRYLMILILGLILAALAPVLMKSASKEVEEHPWISLGLGFLVISVGPVAVLLLLITVLGAPLALILLSLYIFLFYAGKIFAAHWLGDRLIALFWKIREPNIYLSLVLGLFIIAVIGLIPIIGWMAVFVATLMGIGSLVLEINKLHKRAKNEERI